MSYVLRPVEECFYCHAEIPIPFNSLSNQPCTHIKCPSCRRIMRVSSAMWKEKECAHEIETLRTQISAQYTDVSERIQRLEANFFQSRESKIQELFRQAESAQHRGDFQQAESLYNQLLTENPREAEVHWRILLCHFGVEYVYERNSNTTLPTITKICSEDILQSDDYRAALTYAQDVDVVAFYTQEAGHISRILNAYLKIYAQNTPYDVFISVKQGDDHGKATADSLTAKKLYKKLTAQGLKVFNSAITLKDIAGHQFEPYIMHALFTSKVMVVVASNEEYLYSPWVRNEWRRFHWLKEHGDPDRVLIACIIGDNDMTIPALGAIQLLYARNHASALNPLVKSVLKEIPSKKKKFPLIMAGVLIVTAMGIYVLTHSGNVERLPSDFNDLPEMPTKLLLSEATPTPTPTPTRTPTPTATPTINPNTIVTIADSNLKKALLEELGKSSGYNITVKDLEKIIALDLAEKNIKDISSLRYCTSLTVLDLGNNQISDIKPLANLTSLTVLELGNNQISDIKPLANLTSLTVLDLENNQISDIKPLANLTSLTVLELGNNRISDIKPLANITSIEMLGLDTNLISDITPIENFTSLTDLYLYDNQISDIKPIENLTSLTVLCLDNNQISDIKSLANLTSLTELDLWNNQISDIKPLANLTSLTVLYLNNNQISDIKPLANLTSLTELDLWNNQISDITPLAKLTQLDYLDIGGNFIKKGTFILTNFENRGCEVYR